MAQAGRSAGKSSRDRDWIRVPGKDKALLDILNNSPLVTVAEVEATGT